MNQQEKHFVYFYYDKNDTLLYIGKAIDVGARWNGHNDPWKHEVAKIGVISCLDQAAMDVLENYFIAKVPTKYNRAGLQHGYTSFEIPNLPQPTVYTISEFKKRYVRGQNRTSNVPKLPIETRLREAGFEILELGPRPNLFDDELLQKDLDRVCLKYGNYYMVSRYSTHIGIPGNYIRKGELALSHRTNEDLSNIKAWFSHPTLTITELPNGNKLHQIISTADEASDGQILDAVWASGNLYDFYVVKNHNGTECFSSLRCCHHATLSECSQMKNGDGTYTASLEWYGEIPPEAFHPVISKDSFFYDFEQVIQVVNEKYYGTRTLHE